MVKSKRTIAVRRVEIKNQSFERWGCLRAPVLQMNLHKYSINSAGKPIAAFRFDRPRCLRVLMNTL
jgi:hypothetical protein